MLVAFLEFIIPAAGLVLCALAGWWICDLLLGDHADV
jgi:hypothetical protein